MSNLNKYRPTQSDKRRIQPKVVNDTQVVKNLVLSAKEGNGLPQHPNTKTTSGSNNNKNNNKFPGVKNPCSLTLSISMISVHQ